MRDNEHILKGEDVVEGKKNQSKKAAVVKMGGETLN